jgi:DNA-binding NarL/FixJ family response regulator
VKVLLADQHRLLLEGVKAALAGSGRFVVVGEARTGSQLAPLVHQLQPDLVLLELRLPELDGFACLELLARRHPQVQAIALSLLDDRASIERALAAGARGFVAKSIDPRELVDVLEAILAGTRSVVAGEPAFDPAAEGRKAGLTEREIAILAGVAAGRPNRAIAAELCVTEQTVKFHLTNVYRKLGVDNRTAAARAALRLGIASNPLLAATST